MQDNDNIIKANFDDKVIVGSKWIKNHIQEARGGLLFAN